MKSRNLPERICWLAALAILFASLSHSSALAEVKRVDLTVAGLACPFCAYGLEKKLEGIEGVKSIEILLEEGIATVIFEASHIYPHDALKRAVKEAGFTLEDILASLSGRVEGEQEPPQFIMQPTEEEKQAFNLLPTDAEEETEQNSLDELVKQTGDGETIVFLAAKVQEPEGAEEESEDEQEERNLQLVLRHFYIVE